MQITDQRQKTAASDIKEIKQGLFCVCRLSSLMIILLPSLSDLQEEDTDYTNRPSYKIIRALKKTLHRRPTLICVASLFG